MTKFRICAVLAVVAVTALVLSGSLISPALAQSNQYQGNNPAYNQPRPQAQPPAAPTAFIDIGAVLKNHARLNQEKENLKAEAQRMQEGLKREVEGVQQLEEKLKDYRQSSPEYKQLEEQIVKKRSELQITVRLKDREMMQKQAVILHGIYREIQAEIASLAAARGFLSVQRFDGSEVDPEQPEQVGQLITGPVVWFNRGLDITPEIIARINQRSGYTNPSANQPNVTRRPGVPTQPTQYK